MDLRFAGGVLRRICGRKGRRARGPFKGIQAIYGPPSIEPTTWNIDVEEE